MTRAKQPLLNVTVRIDRADSARFDEIVQALQQQGLTDVQPHPRFLIVNGAVAAVGIAGIETVPGVASVRVDRQYRPLNRL